MEGKIKLPIVKNGYDIEAADVYITMLQSEYARVCQWGEDLEKMLEEARNTKADEDEIEALTQQNRTLYNNCVAFAKHIKRLERLKNEQGEFYADELVATDNKKKALEQEILVLEERKKFLEVSSESAKGQAEAIIGAANNKAEEIVAQAQSQAQEILHKAEEESAQFLRTRMAKFSEVMSQLDCIIPKNEE